MRRTHVRFLEACSKLLPPPRLVKPLLDVANGATGRRSLLLTDHLDHVEKVVINQVDQGKNLSSESTAAGSGSSSTTNSNSSSTHQSGILVSAVLAGELFIPVPSKLLAYRMKSRNNKFEWYDISAHPAAALQDYRSATVPFLLSLGIHQTLVESTMEAVLLPQLSTVNNCSCLILRCAVEETSHDMDSIQELTNRITILVTEDRLITLHRTYLQFLDSAVRSWENHSSMASSSYLLHLIVKEAARTFHRALSKSIVQFDFYEAKLFLPQKQRATLAREIYHIKRRASVYSRTLGLLHEAYNQTAHSLKITSYDAAYQDVTQDINHLRGLSEELSDNANTVLQLLFQLSSFQLNELMRVLTMFSAFFIPLSFIASVYGMNFQHLPFLESSNGHWYCLFLMFCVAGTSMMWFRVKKFW